MRFLAVDDEPFALKDLEEALLEASPDALLASFTSPARALAYAQAEPVEIAFLDVELGAMNGLILAKS